MTNYKCYICNEHIKDTLYRGYDKNLCSQYCRESLIKNYRFNSNYQLEKKQKIHSNNSSDSVIINMNYEPDTERHDVINNISMREIFNYDGNILPPRNFSKIFDIQPETFKYYDNDRRSCSYIYYTYINDSVLSNILDIVIKKTKSFVNPLI